MISFNNIKWILIGALIIGCSCSAFFYFTFKSGLVVPQVRFFDIWIPFIVLIFFLLLLRAMHPGKPFHFWQGLLAGNLMVWMGGLFSGLILWQVCETDPVAFQNYLNSSIKYLVETEKILPEDMKMKNLPTIIEDIRNTKPSFLVMDEIKKKVVYSLILVPLVSIIFRRK